MNHRPITGRGPTFSPLAPGLPSRHHTPRRPRTGVVTVAGIIAATLFASSVPTPLYDTYQARWHFSPLILTAIYAVYALAALTALLLVGRVPTISAADPSSLLDWPGSSPPASRLRSPTPRSGCLSPGLRRDWPPVSFSARRRHPHRPSPAGRSTSPGLINGVASAFGLALGAACSAPIVQYAPRPRLLPFAVQAVILVALLAATRRLANRWSPPAGSGCARAARMSPGNPGSVRGGDARRAVVVVGRGPTPLARTPTCRPATGHHHRTAGRLGHPVLCRLRGRRPDGVPWPPRPGRHRRRISPSGLGHGRNGGGAAGHAGSVFHWFGRHRRRFRGGVHGRAALPHRGRPQPKTGRRSCRPSTLSPISRCRCRPC